MNKKIGNRKISKKIAKKCNIGVRSCWSGCANLIDVTIFANISDKKSALNDNHVMNKKYVVSSRTLQNKGKRFLSISSSLKKNRSVA